MKKPLSQRAHVFQGWHHRTGAARDSYRAFLASCCARKALRGPAGSTGLTTPYDGRARRSDQPTSGEGFVRPHDYCGIGVFFPPKVAGRPTEGGDVVVAQARAAQRLDNGLTRTLGLIVAVGRFSQRCGLVRLYSTLLCRYAEVVRSGHWNR